jgi:methylenetetrahydrofolate reductase (NADPH)
MTRPQISFEFFPPRNVEATFRLWDAVQVLSPLAPRFVSVTYGAGGSTRALTQEVVETLVNHSGLPTAAHLTCVNATRDETMEIARGFARAGVRDIVALRGDPPADAAGFVQHPGGFASSVELIEALAATGEFNIRVGAYPERHPEAASDTADIDWLKRKLDAGAEEAITQFFFEAETFLRFRDACAKAGIDKRIVPGILPIENWKGVTRFAERCGTSAPAWLADAFDKAQRDGRTELLATAVCTELCSDLLEEGVDTLHFYTMNRPELTRDVCHALGIVPEARLEKVA